MPVLALHNTPRDSISRNVWQNLFGRKPALLVVTSIVSALVLLVVVLIVMLAFPAPSSDERGSRQSADATPVRSDKKEPLSAGRTKADAKGPEEPEQAKPRVVKSARSTPELRSDSLDLPTLIKHVERAVVRIDTDKGVGTGFLTENNSSVITNFHVIRGSSKATATFQDGSRVAVLGALAIAPENDLAALLLTGPKKSREPLRLAAEPPQKGERVVAFGMPEGLSFSASEGIVSSLRTGRELGNSLQASIGIDVWKAWGLNPESSWIQSSAPISHGNSGGPLVNMRGEVVGVNAMMQTEGQNLNFAVSAKEVRRLLRRAAIPLSLLSRPEATPEPRILGAQKDALKGLVGVKLACGAISDEAARSGMGEAEVRALVERKLRTAHITVFTANESEGPIGILEIRVNVLPSDTGILVNVFDCSVSRFVALNPYAKDHLDVALATVWSARTKFGYAGRQVFGRQMREALEGLLEEFTDAFLAVNGK